VLKMRARYNGSENKIKLKEWLFRMVLTAAGVTIVLLLGGIFFSLFVKALPAIKHNGFYFIRGSVWNPQSGRYGIFSFIVGTLLTSFIALIISVPSALAISVLLSEYLPGYRNGRFFISFLKNATDLLAGVPSVIYGFWGLVFVTPVIRYFEELLHLPVYGVSILAASVVLAIMILPYMASISREVIALVPAELKEASYALGATRYETVGGVVLRYSASGIVASIVLALGRAMGETMAVTMLVGNSNRLPANILRFILGPGNTMASVIANEFAEATNSVYLSSLTEIGLFLFIISLILNGIGKWTVRRFAL